MKSLLAHELAHSYNNYTALHRYLTQAEVLLHEFVYGIIGGVAEHRMHDEPDETLPPLWKLLHVACSLRPHLHLDGYAAVPAALSGYHLLRMRESRVGEFAADRAAIDAYGPQAFINGLTGLLVARRTFNKTLAALREDMRRHKSQNIYAEMRRHYGELPPQVISQLRVEATTGFRTLANSHPTAPDRLRAAYQTFSALLPSPAPTMPAYLLLASAGAPDADTVENELTTLLFNPKK